jgi:hypothetical protein
MSDLSQEAYDELAAILIEWAERIREEEVKT